jgi:hypothetical protein
MPKDGYLHDNLMIGQQACQEYGLAGPRFQMTKPTLMWDVRYVM